MRPILYPSGTTQFDNNGIGVLTDAVSCLVTQELNGKYELTMTYPITGIHFAEISRRCILLAKVDPASALQPFRIYFISKLSQSTVTVKARHIVYDLAGIPVEPFTAKNAIKAMSGLKSHALVDCPFSFSTDKSTVAQFTAAVPAAIWTLFGGVSGSILDVYGGEYEYDRFSVKLLNRRGEDRGVSIRYGKNLTSLQQDENCANCYTGVMPYWVDPLTEEVTMLPEKILYASGTYDYTKILPLDVTLMIASDSTDPGEALETPTMDQIRTAAVSYMESNNIGEPTVSWDISFVQLEQTEEYKGKALLERVYLGDTVTVEFPALCVSTSARAVAYTYNSLLERYESISIGSVRANIADTIVIQEQAVQQAPTKTDLKIAQDAATAWLTNGKGYKVERRDAAGNVVDTLYMDTPDIETAVNVLRIGQSGIGFSNTGVNGPYLSAWTIDGSFNADFITAGTLYGLLFKAGIIQSIDEKITIDLSQGASGPVFNTGIRTNGLTVAGEGANSSVFSIGTRSITDTGSLYTSNLKFYSANGALIKEIEENIDYNSMSNSGIKELWSSNDGTKQFSVSVNDANCELIVKSNGYVIFAVSVTDDGALFDFSGFEIDTRGSKRTMNADGLRMEIGSISACGQRMLIEETTNGLKQSWITQSGTVSAIMETEDDKISLLFKNGSETYGGITFDVANQTFNLDIYEINGRRLDWKSNGDGTYSLIGT